MGDGLAGNLWDLGRISGIHEFESFHLFVGNILLGSRENQTTFPQNALFFKIRTEISQSRKIGKIGKLQPQDKNVDNKKVYLNAIN